MNLGALRLALVTAVDAQTGAVQVTPHPPGEAQDSREAIWVARTESVFEWRSIGQPTRNRTEDITADLRVEVYREGPRQLTAAADAYARCETLLGQIEDAVELDASVAGTVTHGRIAGVSIDETATDAGWVVSGTARFEATNHPT